MMPLALGAAVAVIVTDVLGEDSAPRSVPSVGPVIATLAGWAANAGETANPSASAPITADSPPRERPDLITGATMRFPTLPSRDTIEIAEMVFI
jgi:hypothetical protein